MAFTARKRKKERERGERGELNTGYKSPALSHVNTNLTESQSETLPAAWQTTRRISFFLTLAALLCPSLTLFLSCSPFTITQFNQALK